nr:extracellular solute-binding protein [uncultured Blautia sp.]
MKKYIIIFMVSVLFLYCSGCEKEKQHSTEKTLTVCVEAELGDYARDLLDLWEMLNEGVQGKLEIIPQDSDTAEIKASNIRTELMSGEGPDVFLLSTGAERESMPVLFPNPEKLMYTDTFLPLDDFLETAEYARPEKFNQKILEAGKTEKGQMILPITYTYRKFAFRKTDLEGLQEIPLSWEELRTCENPVLQEAVFYYTNRMYPLFGELADYKEGKLLFTEKELQTMLEEVCAYTEWNEYRENRPEDLSIQGLFDFYPNLAASQDEKILVGIPNKNGGITAEIGTYIAVNRNTKIPDEAFSFLDLLFRDEILFGPGIEVGTKWGGNMFQRWFSDKDHLILNQELAKRYPDLSEADLTALEKLDNQINAVSFYSDLEKELADLYWPYFQSYHAKEEETKRLEMVSKAYETMKMKILE